MRKLFLSMVCASALVMAPAMTGNDYAEAGNFWKGLVGGIVAGAVIGTIVRAGQSHCHEGLCYHSHGYANAYHYHQAYGGPILYRQQAYQAPPPPPVASGYPQAHYQWCANQYRSYDIGSNSYQPFGPNPRRACISPYVR